MNAQSSFGLAVGIPAIFFLGGFLYNALGLTDITVEGADWTPYGLWLMTMVPVAVLSATLLTGSDPNAVTMLVTPKIQPRTRAWYNFLVDAYENEVYPVSIWDRGNSKMEWLQNSQAYQNHAWVSQRIDLGWRSWTCIGTAALVMTLFPSIMAYEMASRIPWPRQGCRSTSYALYIACQVWLIGVGLKRSMSGLRRDDFPVSNAARRYPQPSQMLIRYTVFYFCYGVTVLAQVLAFVISLLGSIFQIFGVYNNCLCQTPISTWLMPASQRVTYLGYTSMEPAYHDRLANFATGMTWDAAVVTGVLCYFGWWYQKVLRNAVAARIESL